MDVLLPELLHEIAGKSVAAYRALVLACPRFARDVSYDRRLDYMVSFGFDCRVINSRHCTMIVWTQYGKKHRIGGPAVIYENGHLGWCVNGSLYYTLTPRGSEFWTQDGKLHREDGPAYIEKSDEDTEYHWYRRGRLHRVGGPAVYGDNYEIWMVNGDLHRLDGPAHIAAGCKTWFIADHEFSEDWHALLTASHD